MTTEERVTEYLKGILARRELANQLGAEPDRLCCYYICPLSNLESIIQRGIKCREAAAAKVDLSSREVQHRRRTIWLGRSIANPRVLRNVQTHSCVNFFWNPLNRTFEAFQRNALLRRHCPIGPADELACLLEIDAESLLQDDRIYWGISAKNIATGSRTFFQLPDLQAPERFRWEAVFASCSLVDREAAKHRAAEFVVFSGCGPDSESVPWSRVRRILLPANLRLTPEAERIVASGSVLVMRSDVYKNANDLLKAERWFISFLADFQRETDAAVADKIEIAFRSLVAFEDRIGTPHRSPYRFRSDSQACGGHGIGHVVRVMFWARLLLCYEDAPDSSASDSSLMAALLHDLCRLTDREDEIHGRVADEQYAEQIRTALGPTGETSVAAAINAVKMHCRDDADCPAEQRDLVWTILKDADALERGRFTPPNRPGGCNRAYLRTQLLKDRDRKDRIGSVAFLLAAITKYTTWCQSPCVDLFRMFYSGIRAAQREGVFESQPSRNLASTLLEKLTRLDEEIYYRQIDDVEWDDQQYEHDHEDDSEYEEDQFVDDLDDDDFNNWDDHDCNMDAQNWYPN